MSDSTMTVQDRIRREMMRQATEAECWNFTAPNAMRTTEEIAAAWDALEETGLNYELLEEFRGSGQPTGLNPFDLFSRHYDGEHVAVGLADGGWVGWPEWSGGGKHGEPQEMEWLEVAYVVEAEQEMRPVWVFSMPSPRASALIVDRLVKSACETCDGTGVEDGGGACPNCTDGVRLAIVSDP